MRELRPGSVLLGVLVDKLAFVAAAVLLALAVGVEAPAFQTLALALGLLTVALGGFAAARHAQVEAPLHGLGVGVLGSALSLARFAVNSTWPPAETAARHALGWELAGWIGAPLAGLLGGLLARALARPAPQELPPAGSWWLWLPVYLAVIAFFAFLEQLG
jgi:hypothetical protein